MTALDWTELPRELLIQIVENGLLNVVDFVNFSCVCHTWYHAANTCDKAKLQDNWREHQMPWLMLADGTNYEVESIPNSVDGHDNIKYGDPFWGDQPDLPNVSLINEEAKEDGNDSDLGDNELYNYLTINRRCYERILLNLSLNMSKCYNLNLPQVYGKACWGSPYGWIVTLGLDREMDLFNPLTKARLPLPSQRTFRYPWKRASKKTIRNQFISKAVVLRVPNNYHNQTQSSTLLVVVMHRRSHLVAIARPRDLAWEPIHYPEPRRPLMDVIYSTKILSSLSSLPQCLRRGSHNKWGKGGSDGKQILPLMDVIYSTKMNSLIFVDSYRYFKLWYCDLHDRNQPLTLKSYVLGPRSFQTEDMCITYIVEFSDYFLVITRVKKRRIVWLDEGLDSDYFDVNSFKTKEIKLYKLDRLSMVWEELQDLPQGVAVFVGCNTTTCVFASNAGCTSNCIFFCDDRLSFRDNVDRIAGHDIGIYDMRDGLIKPFDNIGDPKSSYCGPIWFTPSV